MDLHRGRVHGVDGFRIGSPMYRNDDMEQSMEDGE